MDTIPFIPGEENNEARPLARFLPPIPAGVGAAFLERHASAGEWVLDPFGAAPSLAVELARSGKKVLVAVNNPVTRFLLELAAAPPTPADLQGALADLASARKGGERLETHLQSLYLTECRKCQRQVPAEAFIWESGRDTPTGRIYQCPCGEGGEFPATESDQARALSIAATDSLHRARALERVAAPDDPDRLYAEQSLDCYLPRAVYALITVVNKIDSLSLTKERLRALQALVLAACDEGNTLWPHPSERPRPKQLTTPALFREKNLWLALEQAVQRWGTDQPVLAGTWPTLPAMSGEAPGERTSGAVYVFDGPMRQLAPALAAIRPGAVVTVLPRPNQAFWTLSALWTGILWGSERAASFKNVLRRRRYDWNWHSQALLAALKNVSPHLPLNTPLFALLAEPEPAFLSAALLAAAGAGFDLEGLALRTRHDPIQITWRRRVFLREEQETSEPDRQVVQSALEGFLRQRAEPVPYLHLHAAGLTALADDHSLHWQEEAVASLQGLLQIVLEVPAFLHLSESAALESGLWDLAVRPVADSLPDQVEKALVAELHKDSAITLRQLETNLNKTFTGLQTPARGLVRAILGSYGLQNGDGWSLRPEDAAAARRADLEQAVEQLTHLARLLRYTPHYQQEPWRQMCWLESGKTAWRFTLMASAVVGRLFLEEPQSGGRNVLCLPGGRAGLLAYKLRRDPRQNEVARHWQVLKFRQLRRLADLPTLERARWEKELGADPLEPPEQMKLF